MNKQKSRIQPHKSCNAASSRNLCRARCRPLQAISSRFRPFLIVVLELTAVEVPRLDACPIACGTRRVALALTIETHLHRAEGAVRGEGLDLPGTLAESTYLMVDEEHEEADTNRRKDVRWECEV